VDRWHLPSIEASGKREPRVLFSRPECRAVLLDLNPGDDMDYRLHEQSVVHVVSGTVEISSDGRTVECDAGTVATFARGEQRSVRAIDSSRILLLLVPWPGAGHFREGENADPARMPATAVPPLD
jgi:quercetin dioxygenase-like cupin family protein